MPNIEAVEAVQQIIAKKISEGVSIDVHVTTSCAWRVFLIHCAVWLLKAVGGFNNIKLTQDQQP